jgi:hypothetical protein
MKTYRVTIRLNVETPIPSSKQLSEDFAAWLTTNLPRARSDGASVDVASITAYEDVLCKDAA